MTRRVGLARWGILAVALMALMPPDAGARTSAPRPTQAAPRGGTCDRWVAPNGSNGASGTSAHPWATLDHAARAVRDAGCTVWFRDGTYRGYNEVERPFRTRTTFRAVHRYRAVFVSSGAALDLGGNARNIVFRGLNFRQSGSGAGGVLLYVSGSSDGRTAPHDIVLRDNVIHDSWGDDLLKIRGGSNHIRVLGNVFYNQSESEQHMDVNGATDITIAENLFFNDFAGSGRPNGRDTKHSIVVKDSDGRESGVLGSRRIKIERNVFLRWQGGDESIIAVGNDGDSYFEARQVRVVNNLFLGNGTDHVNSPLQVYGAKGVSFLNNTVTGNLPADSYGFDVDIKDSNPRNEDVRFSNNIWSDATGTMGSFSNGERSHTLGLVLRRNLYWNGGRSISRGDLLGPRDDPMAIIRNPRLPRDQRDITLPFWKGDRFRSGNRTIHREFLRIVRRWGTLPTDSPALGRALATFAPDVDILGHRRGASPDLGAFEARG